ncbi:peptidase family M1-domain-containing protein, partial [Blyttiomyces helicus]
IRLPPWVVPSHYGLDITVDIDAFAFAGSSAIDLAVTESTAFVAFHAVALDVRDAVVVPAGGKDAILPARVDERPESEYTLLWFDPPLEVGNYTLTMKFKGTLTDGLRGFYYSTFTGAIDGKTKYVAATQFQATDARRAFPSLDEPGLKATFQVNFTTPSGFHGLGNMPALEIVPVANGARKFVFDTTPVMSTYLVAFIASNFESVSGKTSRGVNVSVFTQPGRVSEGRYALEVAIQTLEFYEEKYMIEYPLPKSDLIAIPDFGPGAMENWGLVTFQETALLYKEGQTSAEGKYTTASILGHELAHQWFGNIVTMEWWNDLWLNEGFAERMQYLSVDAIEPTWRVEEFFVPLDLSRALLADSSYFTHSIAVPLSDPADIFATFDDVSYGKGAAVIRMLQGYLGTAINKSYFFSQIQAYLKAHEYANAKTADLWQALDQDPRVDVVGLMSTFTDQPGYPVVSVSSTSGKLSLKQERFIFAQLAPPEPLADAVDPATQLWKIPLAHAVYRADNTVPGGVVRVGAPSTVVFGARQTPLSVDGADVDGVVVLLNAGREGVYRVQYDQSTYETIVGWLEKSPQALPSVDKAGLISDIFALWRAGLITDVSIPLNLTRYLASESDAVVWKMAIADINVLEQVLALESAFGRFQKYKARIMGPLVQSLGWIETSDNQLTWNLRARLRSELLSEAVTANYAPTVKTALEYFAELRSETNARLNSTAKNLSPDVLNVIYDTGVIYGTEDDYEWVLAQYLDSNATGQVKARLLHALASAKIPYLQKRTLDLILQGHVRKQDVSALIDSVSLLSPETGTSIAWEFLMDNWPRIVKIWQGMSWKNLNNLLEKLTSRFVQPLLIAEADRRFILQADRDFFVPPSAQFSVRKGLEKARQNVAWLDRFGAEVGVWLKRELERA